MGESCLLELEITEGKFGPFFLKSREGEGKSILKSLKS
jgi:hypothetical protein